MEGRILQTGEADTVLIVAVAGIVVAVEEHFHFIHTAVQQAVNTLTACMMILTDLIDQRLLVDIIQIKRTRTASAGNIVGIDKADRSVAQLDLPP